SSGATLSNSGTLDDQGGSVVWYTGTQPTFTNSGTFRVQAADGVSVGVALTSSGTIDVRAGTLRLSGGGTLGGTTQGATGTALRSNSGDYAVPAGARLAVPTVVFAGGAADVRGTYEAAAETRVAGGTASFGAAATLTSLGQLLTVSGGAANFAAGTALTL